MIQVVTHAVAFTLGAFVAWAVFRVAGRNRSGDDAPGPGSATTATRNVVWQETLRLIPPYFVGTGILTAVTAGVLLLTRVLAPADAQGGAGALAAGVGHGLAAALLISLGWWVARGAESSDSVPVSPEGIR